VSYYFEYYDVGDRMWKKLKNVYLVDVKMSAKEWFRDIGLKVK
jgi:hypothetical protein